MAFDSPSPGPPEAPRPVQNLWHELRQERVQWEGQVLVVGSGVDIPALLVLTGDRLALIHDGTLALDAPRSWLRPEPRLLSENGVRISMTPQGGTGKIDETDRVTVRVRDGRGSAARFVGAVSGRLVSPREEVRAARSGAADAWAGSVGAAASIALPPLPDFGDSLDVSARSWPPVEHNVIPAPVTPEAKGSVSSSGWARDDAEATTSPSRASTGSVVIPQTTDHEHHQFNRGLVWGLRSVILAVIVFVGLYFGRDSLPANVEFTLPANIEQRFGLADDQETGDVGQVRQGTEQDQGAGSTADGETSTATEINSDGTNGAPNSDRMGTSDSGDDGLGGQSGEITPVDPGIGDFVDPTVAPSVEEPVADDSTDGQPQEEVDPPVDPTIPPSTETPATEAPVTQVVSTEAPATDVPMTEVPVTEAPTEDSPATETPARPTDIPGRPDPTVTVTPDEAATEIPITEEPEPEATLESQPASVDAGSTPEQALASGEFRYAITGAARGETVAELPDLQAVGGYGEWVVLSMYGQNWSGTEQVFDVGEFRLFADGQEVLVDVGNAWVSGLLGHTPAYGNTDAILWAADEGHPFALTFLAPPGAEQLTLVAGDQAIDLSAALAEPQPLAQDASDAPALEYMDAEVVDVFSAEAIVIEIDGIQQTVRYLGLDVPTDDDCYAAEATAANRQLVEGKTVRLERQATDVDARGNWVRDVWAPAGDGRYFLVGEALVANGAATVGISEPNTRYEGWLLGSQSIARSDGLGLWGACESEAAGASSQPAAIAPAPHRGTFRRTASGG